MIQLSEDINFSNYIIEWNSKSTCPSSGSSLFYKFSCKFSSTIFINTSSHSCKLTTEKINELIAIDNLMITIKRVSCKSRIL